jgi:hypothetical protein
MKEAIAAAKKAMGSYGENDYFEDYEETEPDASGQYEDFEASGTCPEGELMRVWVDKEGPVAFNMFRTDGDEDDDDDEDDKDEDDEDEEDGGEDELADVDQPAPGPAEIERSFQILREAMVKIEDEIKESVAEVSHSNSTRPSADPKGLNEEALRRVVAIGLRERVKGFTDASGFI